MSSAPVKGQSTEMVAIKPSHIWYNDGSIILQVASKQFRVHWSVLGRNSSWFRDFEHLPEQPTIGRCPILKLPDTSDVDFQYVLEALYDPHFLGQTTLSLDAVGAMIRLGRKYNFKGLLESAVERFTSQAPATLAGYDALLIDGNYPTRIRQGSGRFCSQFLLLAQENGIISTLPVAYLHAAQLHIASIVSDFSTDLDTLKRCLIGREILFTQQFQPGYPLGWITHSQDCRDHVCGSNRRAEFRGYMEEKRVEPLYNFNADHWRNLMCGHCYQHALQSNAAARQRMWEELRGIFGLPQ
ncbi:hypothetical protein C8R45DRAFT_135311 [Mycena sanguinolenta]|nr:hypothetical protein C8R45DRAFT_135311 [Mycena sanguinolenta]